MRFPTVLACAAVATATPTPNSASQSVCGGAETVAEFDLYPDAYYYDKVGCGAGPSNGTLLGHYTGCESDILRPPISSPGSGPEKCQSLKRTDGGAFITTKVRKNCYISMYQYDDCKGYGDLTNDEDYGKCVISNPGFVVGAVPYRSWKILCN